MAPNPVAPVKPVAPCKATANTPLPYNTFDGLPSKFKVAILPMPLTLPTATELAVPAVTAYVALATVPVTLAPVM